MAESESPSLEELNPKEAWKPWEPDNKNDPWNSKWAGHLYRRAGFGANLAAVQASVKSGFEATIQEVMEGGKDYEAYSSAKERAAPTDNVYNLRGWWQRVLLESPHPLREKMTLFWHNHFATSIDKVKYPALMFEQNKLFRKHALGKFGPLLLAISKNPAMIVYLDGDTNSKDKPNENFARELLELFSLGIGNYKESDVRQGARAFTGWHAKGMEFQFQPARHDDGTKVFLGKEGKWDGDDIVRILLEQASVASFLVGKFYRFFVSESANPPPAFLAPLVDAFRKSDYDIKSLLGDILRSRHFYSAQAFRQRIKSPVEFVIGAIQEIAPTLIVPEVQVGRLEAMGQQLFAPPNVKGWSGGRYWLNTATILARSNFAEDISCGSSKINQGDEGHAPPIIPAVDPAAFLRKERISEPAAVVAKIAEILFQGEVDAKTQEKLVVFMKEGKPAPFEMDRRIREVYHAMMCMPEYQLA